MSQHFIAVTPKNQKEELAYYQQIYSTYGIQFIKTIRSDQGDYYDKFVGAILGEHKEPLRVKKTSQQIYKVGMRDKKIQILKANEAGKFLPPQFSVEEKQGKSKKMSLTVISSKQQYLTELFGLGNQGRTTGIIFFTESGGESENDKQIILPSLIFKNDSGTVGRTFYFESEEKAKNYIKNKGLYVNVQQLINVALERGDVSYNEVLGRLQWLPNDPRCHIGIFSDDLKSTLLAQLRAIDLKINTNANYIPITFYDRSNKNLPFSGYLLEERQADVKQGLSLSANNHKSNLIKSMALLIKKYEESQLSNNILLVDEEKMQLLTVLLKFKFTRKTTIQFLKIIYFSNRFGDVDITLCAICDHLLASDSKNIIKFNIIINCLELIPNINDESTINKLLVLYDKFWLFSRQLKMEFLEKMLKKITELSPNRIEILLRAIGSSDLLGKDNRLNYLEKILEKITDFNHNIIEKLLKGMDCFESANARLNYFEKILEKITDFNPNIIEKLLQGMDCLGFKDSDRLNYFEKILEKITDFTPNIIEKLLQAKYRFRSAGAELNYLEKINQSSAVSSGANEKNIEYMNYEQPPVKKMRHF